jgi:hypothetical protein
MGCETSQGSSPVISVVAVHGVGDAEPGAILRDLSKLLSGKAQSHGSEHHNPDPVFRRDDWVVNGQVYPRMTQECGSPSACKVKEIIEVNWADVLRPAQTSWDVIKHLLFVTLAMLRLSCDPAPGGRTPRIARLHVRLFAGGMFWLWLLAMMVMLLASCGAENGLARGTVAVAFPLAAVVLARFLGRYEVAFVAGYAWAAVLALAAGAFLWPRGWNTPASWVAWSGAAYGWSQAILAFTLTAAFIEALAVGRGLNGTQRFARGGLIWIPFIIYSAAAVGTWASALYVAREHLNLADHLAWEQAFLPQLRYDLKAAEIWMMRATLAIGLLPACLGVLAYGLPQSLRRPLRLAAPGRAVQDVFAFTLWAAPFILAAASTAFWVTTLSGGPDQRTGVSILAIYAMSAARLAAFLPLALPPARIVLDVMGDILFHLQSAGAPLDSKAWTSPRLGSLLQHLRRATPRRRIVVLAHSQGTVVSWNVLRQDSGLGDAFVTMGSPLESLYGRFLGGIHERPEPAGGGWRNLYRDGDYIAGPIRAAQTNESIGAGGHTNYWSDARILEPVMSLLATSDDSTAADVRF